MTQHTRGYVPRHGFAGKVELDDLKVLARDLDLAEHRGFAHGCAALGQLSDVVEINFNNLLQLFAFITLLLAPKRQYVSPFVCDSPSSNDPTPKGVYLEREKEQAVVGEEERPVLGLDRACVHAHEAGRGLITQRMHFERHDFAHIETGHGVLHHEIHALGDI